MKKDVLDLTRDVDSTELLNYLAGIVSEEVQEDSGVWPPSVEKHFPTIDRMAGFFSAEYGNHQDFLSRGLSAATELIASRKRGQPSVEPVVRACFEAMSRLALEEGHVVDIPANLYRRVAEVKRTRNLLNHRALSASDSEAVPSEAELDCELKDRRLTIKSFCINSYWPVDDWDVAMLEKGLRKSAVARYLREEYGHGRRPLLESVAEESGYYAFPEDLELVEGDVTECDDSSYQVQELYAASPEELYEEAEADLLEKTWLQKCLSSDHFTEVERKVFALRHQIGADGDELMIYSEIARLVGLTHSQVMTIESRVKDRLMELAVDQF